MTPTTRRPRPQLVILTVIAGVGLAIAVGAGLAMATDAWFLFHDGYSYAFVVLAAAGLAIAVTALAILAGRTARSAPRWFWRLAALLGVTVCAGLASSTCAGWANDSAATLVTVGLGAAALALVITTAVIKIAADRGVVRFFALVGIAAYPAGWLMAFAWGEDFNPIGYAAIIFIIPAATLAGARAGRQYRISRPLAVDVGCWAAHAVFLAALAFAWGFHANSHLCLNFYYGGHNCQSHLNEVVFTLIAGGVPPALAAGAAWLAGVVCQRRGRPPS